MRRITQLATRARYLGRNLRCQHGYSAETMRRQFGRNYDVNLARNSYGRRVQVHFIIIDRHVYELRWTWMMGSVRESETPNTSPHPGYGLTRSSVANSQKQLYEPSGELTPALGASKSAALTEQRGDEIEGRT